MLPGDVILSLDGVPIYDQHDWIVTTDLLGKQSATGFNITEYIGWEAISERKGYCVPDATLEESKKIRLVDYESGCPDDFFEFVAVNCINTNISGDINNQEWQPDRRENRHCLNAKDIVKLNKCGHGWGGSPLTNKSSCMCYKVEI